MLNVFKKVKDFFSGNSEKEVSSGEEMPGMNEPKKDVGKKVFEKTGQVREGVGQSSTVSHSYSKKTEDESPKTPVKLHHGIRKRKNVVNASSKSNSGGNTSSSKRNNKYRSKYKQKSK